MSIYTIYKFVNLINNKSYIGFTKKNPSKRLIEHKSAVNTGSDYALHEAMRKYGVDNFKFEIVYQSWDKHHTLNIMEPYFIKEHNSFISENGYNMTYGGQGGMLDKIHSEKTREKMSSAWTEERKRKCSRRMMLNNPSKSETVKQKMSLAKIGKSPPNKGKKCNWVSIHNKAKFTGRSWIKDPETGKRVWC